MSMIAIIAMGAYCALYFLVLGAAGMAIEICTTLRDGWSAGDADWPDI